MQVAESHLNTKNKNTCGEESRDLEVDDSARGPFKARRECGGGGGGRGRGGDRGRGGGFCLETTLSNLLQDADISRKLSSCRGGSAGVEAATHPRCEIKTGWAEPESLQAAVVVGGGGAATHAHHSSPSFTCSLPRATELQQLLQKFCTRALRC